MSRDPLLRCGFLVCPDCGKIGYPSEAVWISEDQILATYPRACSHRRDITWIVTPSELGAARIENPELCMPGRRCTGTTRAGNPCRSYASAGSPFCPQHASQEAS